MAVHTHSRKTEEPESLSLRERYRVGFISPEHRKADGTSQIGTLIIEADSAEDAAAKALGFLSVSHTVVAVDQEEDGKPFANEDAPRAIKRLADAVRTVACHAWAVHDLSKHDELDVFTVGPVLRRMASEGENIAYEMDLVAGVLTQGLTTYAAVYDEVKRRAGAWAEKEGASA